MKAVLIFIARKTYGFHKKTDEISLTQFEKNTGLSRPTVVATLEKLKSVRLIIQLRKGRSKHVSSEWKIDLEDWEDKLVKLTELVKNSDTGLASPLVKPPLHTKETQKKFYNYQETSLSYKETTLGKNPNGGTKSQPKRETPTDVVFLSQLKRLGVKVDSRLNSLTDVQLYKEYELSRNTEACIQGILFYIRKYKAVLGIDHPRYKLPQLENCMYGFLNGIWEIERLNLPIEDTGVRVINRWFATNPPDPNKLRLSHFIGSKQNDVNIIFYNCLQEVLLDIGYYRREDNVDS